MVERVRRRHYAGWVFLLVLVILGVGAVMFVNERGYGVDLATKAQDLYRGWTYQPSDEMARIRSDLKLTEQGEFLFNAAQPELYAAAEFNSHCRDGETEIAVLGCYTGGNIYIYNITDAELDGIRELTTAHELLHAVWARMGDEEKTALVASLTKVFEENQEFLEGEIDTYDVSEKQEELYVRAGTEVANLPEDLERHYAEFFRDQDAVVAFYDKYIAVFRNLRAELDTLAAELATESATIQQMTAEYETRSNQLSASVVSFNSCAEVRGCFSTEEEFDERRAALVAEQEALEGMYGEINGLIGAYNAKVELYNADVTQGERLNTIINSAAKPQEVK